MEQFFAHAQLGSVTVGGEVDMGTAPDLRIALETAVDGSDGEITIDLTSVSFIDSSGIRELVRPVNHGHRVVVTGASPTVRRTFLLAGLDEVIDLSSDESDERSSEPT